MENKFKREAAERVTKQAAKRTKSSFGRVKFYGDAKQLNELMDIMKAVD